MLKNNKICRLVSKFRKDIDISNVKKQIKMFEIVGQNKYTSKNVLVAKINQFCYTRGAMIKTIDVAGIQLDNYTVRETIMNVEKNISDDGFHTIEEVNMDMLMLAESDEVIRGALDMAEHTVIAERGILEAVGEDSYQRRHEIDHHDFFYEMMKRIERNRLSIFLIGLSSEQTTQMSNRILELYPKCNIVGEEALEECTGNPDALINEINAQTPDVIISVIPSPMQEHFLMENKEKLSARLWYGMGTMELEEPKHGFANGIRKMIRTHKLEKHLNHYSKKQESE